MDSYFIQWVVINYSHYFFSCLDCPDLTSGNAFQRASVSFRCVPTIFGEFFYFLMQQDVSGLSCPFLAWNQPFSKELWFLLVENGI